MKTKKALICAAVIAVVSMFLFCLVIGVVPIMDDLIIKTLGYFAVAFVVLRFFGGEEDSINKKP
jgi:hypothetical protein